MGIIILLLEKKQSVAVTRCIITGAEDRSAPQHIQIQPLAGRQPDAHLLLQQVPLPDSG